MPQFFSHTLCVSPSSAMCTGATDRCHRAAPQMAYRLTCGRRYILIIYDHKQACEGLSRPDVRVAPLQKDRMRKMVHAVLEARREAMQHETRGLMVGDMYAFFDGAKPKLKVDFKKLQRPYLVVETESPCWVC